MFDFLGKKWPKIKNNYICHVSYLRNSIAYDHDFWYTCVKWWYLQAYFQFFKIWFFGLKGKKRSKMTKNCPSCFISQEPYIIWMSFMVHLCKMIISPGVFFIFFKIMIFLVVRWVKGQKNEPKWPKVLSFMLDISGTMHYTNVIYGTLM